MKEIVVSEIQIIPVKPKNGLVAFASCVINSQFFIGDIAIHTRPDGQDYRLVYPCKVLPNGKRINCFHPINREGADQLTEAIVSRFRELIEKVEKTRGKSEVGIRTEG
jgi:DNA-binding cell septation regulator SpoVG